MRDSIASAIAGFSPVDSASTAHSRAAWLDRRRSTRHDVGTVGVIRSDRAGSSALGMQVLIVDVSLGGVGFRSPAEFTSGTLWRIHIGTGPIFLSSRLKVIGSRPRKDGTWEVGAEFL